MYNLCYPVDVISFYETIEASFKLCIGFLSNLCKKWPEHSSRQNFFPLQFANDCFVNLSYLNEMLIKKQIKYFDVSSDCAWKVPILQKLLNTRMHNLYVEWFNDNVITEMISMLCNVFLGFPVVITLRVITRNTFFHLRRSINYT